MNKSDN